MVAWVRDIGATAINLQPLEQHTAEAKDEFWIGPDELDDLIAVRDRLLAMKRAGAPILNSELLLNLWPNHFRREKAPRGVDAVPGRHAKFLHPLRWPRRSLLEFSADRQRADANGP